jgi:hypothetical protein
MQSQDAHVEILAEKLTVRSILSSVARECNGKEDGKDVAFPVNISLTVAKNAGDWRIAAMHFSTLTGGAGG